MDDWTRRAAPGGNLLDQLLAKVPTVFGRLAFLAQLRDAAGTYSHPALNEQADSIESDRALSHYHHRIFHQWIAFSLAEQKAELDQYLATSQQPVDLAFGRSLVPHTAHEVERLLFLTDLETLLELLRLDHGGVFGGPGSSPRR